MKEFERWILGGNFLPKLPDTELAFAHIRVMEENDTSIRDPILPSLEIMADSFVCMHPVNVKDVDFSALEILPGLIERLAYKRREGREIRLIITRDVFKHLVAVKSGMLVAHPGIDGVSLRRSLAYIDRLTESRIRVARMGSKFDEQFGPGRFYEPKRKRDVASPRSRKHKATGFPVNFSTEINKFPIRPKSAIDHSLTPLAPKALISEISEIGSLVLLCRAKGVGVFACQLHAG